MRVLPSGDRRRVEDSRRADGAWGAGSLRTSGHPGAGEALLRLLRAFGCRAGKQSGWVALSQSDVHTGAGECVPAFPASGVDRMVEGCDLQVSDRIIEG